MADYLRPHHLDEALAALAAAPWVVLAGGTDFYPARVGQPLDEAVLDISAIEALKGIEDRGDHYRIGALATWSDIQRQPLPRVFHGLQQAAREVGGLQVQNSGTLVGNLCNASPAADGVPTWLALDTLVELSTTDRQRLLPLEAFITGNRQTRREPNELVTALRVPKLPSNAQGAFLKLGARHYLVISIVMVAGVLIPEGDRVGDIRLAVGACSAVARRQRTLEAALRGQPLAGLETQISGAPLQDLSPIDDCRASAAYRREASGVLLQRLVQRLAQEVRP